LIFIPLWQQSATSCSNLTTTLASGSEVPEELKQANTDRGKGFPLALSGFDPARLIAQSGG
jgi:hypothetical protein